VRWVIVTRPDIAGTAGFAVAAAQRRRGAAIVLVQRVVLDGEAA
jgi:hypothetical protein